MILNAVIPGGVWVEEWGLGGQPSRQRDEPVEGPQGAGDCGQHKAEGSAVGMEREGDRGEWASDETASSVELCYSSHGVWRARGALLCPPPSYVPTWHGIRASYPHT